MSLQRHLKASFPHMVLVQGSAFTSLFCSPFGSGSKVPDYLAMFLQPGASHCSQSASGLERSLDTSSPRRVSLIPQIHRNLSMGWAGDGVVQEMGMSQGALPLLCGTGTSEAEWDLTHPAAWPYAKGYKGQGKRCHPETKHSRSGVSWQVQTQHWKASRGPVLPL